MTLQAIRSLGLRALEIPTHPETGISLESLEMAIEQFAIKALVLTPEGEHLRGRFWRNLVTDPGPLTPLREPDLRALTRLLARLDQPAG